MKIIFDQGVPFPLRKLLVNHQVDTALYKGWDQLENGDLILSAEEEGYDLLVTTDQNLQYQQNLDNRKIAILVLLSTSWPRIQHHIEDIIDTINKIGPGDYVEVEIP